MSTALSAAPDAAGSLGSGIHGIEMLIRPRPSAALLNLLLFASLCVADHLPPELQARGKPEKTLAGIHLNRDKVSDVIKLYGKPSKVENEAEPSDPNRVDVFDYYWNKLSIKLRLVVYRGSQIKGGEQIALIEVEGSRATGIIGTTGSGLRLGGSLTDLRRIYGNRFGERKITKLGIHDVMLEWRSEEYSLIAEFDRRGRIKKLSLSSPE